MKYLLLQNPPTSPFYKGGISPSRFAHHLKSLKEALKKIEKINAVIVRFNRTIQKLESMYWIPAFAGMTDFG